MFYFHNITVQRKEKYITYIISARFISMLRLNIGVWGGGINNKTEKRKCLPVRKEDFLIQHVQSIIYGKRSIVIIREHIYLHIY